MVASLLYDFIDWSVCCPVSHSLDWKVKKLIIVLERSNHNMLLRNYYYLLFLFIAIPMFSLIFIHNFSIVVGCY